MQIQFGATFRTSFEEDDKAGSKKWYKHIRKNVGRKTAQERIEAARQLVGKLREQEELTDPNDQVNITFTLSKYGGRLYAATSPEGRGYFRDEACGDVEEMLQKPQAFEAFKTKLLNDIQSARAMLGLANGDRRWK